jgi:hypothetical protein
MCRLFPDIVYKFKYKRNEYKDKWKKFLKSLINGTDYFKELSFNAKEELLYSLKSDSFEDGQIIFDSGDIIKKLYYI